MSSNNKQDTRVAIVTGGNKGIGFETAKALARQGIAVILACRNLKKAESAKAKILQLIPGAQVDCLFVDLSSLESVRAFSRQFKAKYSKLNILINNAAVWSWSFEKSLDDIELHFAVNYLGHFYLTQLLLNLMPNEPSSRVVSVSSNAHKSVTLDFENLNSQKDYSSFRSYSKSKLACLLFSNELNSRLKNKGKKILAVAAHPGGSDTEISRQIPKVIYFLLKYFLYPSITHPPTKACLPIVHAATAPEVTGGNYFGPVGMFEMSGPPGPSTRSKYSLDKNISEKLWKVSEELVLH